MLKIDESTEPIDNFPDPMICCCFISDDVIFVSLFHNQSLTHYHFLFNTNTKEISQVSELKFDMNDCSDENFPQRCFYNETGKEIYTFYRQGHAVTIPIEMQGKSYILKDFVTEKPLNKSLGELYLIEEQALVA